MNKRHMTSAVLAMVLFLSGAPVLFAQSGETDHRAVIREVATHFSSDHVLFGMIPDVPALKEKLTSHPLADALQNEKIRDLFQPLQDDEKVQEFKREISETTGKSIDELTDLMTGPVAVAVDVGKPNRSSDATPASLKEQARSVMLMKVGQHEQTIANDIIPALIEKTKQKQRERDTGRELFERTETFAGQELHTMLAQTEDGTETGPAWAFVKQYLVVVSPDSTELLKQMVRRLQGNPPQTPLSETDRFVQGIQSLRRSDLFVYANAGQFVDEMQKKYAPDGQQNKGGSGDEMTYKMIKALGFDTFRGAFAQLNLGEKRTSVRASLTYSERTGLTKLLALKPISPGSLGLSLPSAAVSASVMRLSMQQMWTEIMAVFNEVNPRMSQLLQGQLDRVEKQYSVNIETDVVGSLGEQFYTATFPPSGEEVSDDDKARKIMEAATRQVVMISLQDQQRLESAIQRLKDSAGQGKSFFTEREYLGTTIYSIRPEVVPGQSGGMRPSYAILDGHLVYSNFPETIETVVSHENSGEEGLFETAQLQRAIDRLPPDAASFSYSNLSSSLGFLLDQWRTLFRTTGAGDNKYGYINLDADVRADTIRQYVQDLFGGIYMNDQRFQMIWHLQHEKQ